MKYSKKFKILSDEMSEFLEDTTVEVLVRHGFRVGTAGKIVTYGSEDLESTTINTLKDLVYVINEVEGGDLKDRFDSFLEEAFILIDKAPRTSLLNDTGFSPSTIAGIRSKGADGNYQTSKFLTIVDVAQKYNIKR